MPAQCTLSYSLLGIGGESEVEGESTAPSTQRRTKQHHSGAETQGLVAGNFLSARELKSHDLGLVPVARYLIAPYLSI